MAAVQLTEAEVVAALARWGLTLYRPLDEWYWCVTPDYWDLILANFPPSPSWIANFRDCDDIAEWFREECYRRFKVKPGIVVNRSHAFNIAVRADGTLRLIDAMWNDGFISQAVYVEPGSSLHELVEAKVWG